MRGLATCIGCIFIQLLLSAGSVAENEPLVFGIAGENGPKLRQRIYSLHMDEKGFIWLGTEAGLLRYDGYQSERLITDNEACTSILSSSIVKAIEAGRDSCLWIGSSLGLIRLDPDSWKASREEAFSGKHIRAILVQDGNTLWVGTSEGLFRYNPLTKETRLYNHLNSGLSQNVIRCLHLDRDGNLWVGTADKLNLLRVNEARFKPIDLKGTYKPRLRNNLILDIKDYPGRADSLLLVGTETGLCILNRISLDNDLLTEQSAGLANEVIKTIYSTEPERVYCGTDRGLGILNLLSRREDRLFHNPFNRYSLLNNVIWKICPDQQGQLWMATSGGLGILQERDPLFNFVPVYFHEKDALSGTAVNRVLMEENGAIWASTTSGLFRIDSERGPGKKIALSQPKQNLNLNNVNTFCRDAEGRFWIGTMAGINIWDPKRQQMFSPQMDDGSKSRIESCYIAEIIPDQQQICWVSTWGGGLYKVKSNEENTEEIQISFVGQMSGDIVSTQEYLFGRRGNQLIRFSKSTEVLKHEKSLDPYIGAENIQAMCSTREAMVWIGLKNRMIRFSPQNNELEVVQLPLDTDFLVTGLIEDKQGILWGSDSNALFSFDPDSRSFCFYPLTKQLPLKKIIRNPFCHGKGNELIVCGHDGFVHFDPQSVREEAPQSKTLITKIVINGESLLPGHPSGRRHKPVRASHLLEELELDQQQSNLVFHFSRMHYRPLFKGQYAYRLLGYDNEWKNTAPGSNEARFSKLPPGDYSLQVCSPRQTTNGPYTTLDIHVQAPFRASTAAILLYIFLLIVVTGSILYLQLSRKRIVKRMEQLQIEKEQEALMNSSRIRFFVRLSRELINPLDLITNPIRKSLKRNDLDNQLREDLMLAEKQAAYLKSSVDQLLDFRKLELNHKLRASKTTFALAPFCEQVLREYKNRALDKGIVLRFINELKDLDINSDQEKLYFVCKSLISNALQSTLRGGRLVLCLAPHSTDKVQLIFKDNSPGIPGDIIEDDLLNPDFRDAPPDPTGWNTGIGLSLIRHYVHLIQGEIKQNRDPLSGRSVHVIIPVQDCRPKQRDRQKIIDIVNAAMLTENRQKINDDPQLRSDRPDILLVDENQDLYLFLRNSLSKQYALHWASSAEEAQKKIKEAPPAIIISEIQLPGINGIVFCKSLRKNQRTNRIPIIVLTADGERQKQVEASRAGVDVFLTKPCDADILEANLANLLQRIKRTEAFISKRLIMDNKEFILSSKEEKLLKEVAGYIHEHMSNSQITAREISHDLGISHANLYRRIKQATGLSLNEFIRQVRLQKAEKLLSAGKLSVSEVMFQVGFTNHSYFSKCFKTLYGQTPGKYVRD
ncbi:MAG: hypothetical protein CSA96_08500 [Bacteroidetes bacterium]|nr:MAG: hypothetical protein CSA96_08500 [Bacteroidota bacterium]